jgi:hypothetical protein
MKRRRDLYRMKKSYIPTRFEKNLAGDSIPQNTL